MQIEYISAFIFINSGRATKIVVGSNDLKKGGTTYEVEEAIVHEKYGSFSIYSFPINDIGLFRVNKIEINNSTVKPIKYSDKYIEADTVLQTFGWGKLTVSFNCLLSIKNN